MLLEMLILLIPAVYVRALDVTPHIGAELLPETKYSLQACHYKIVGLRGFITSPFVSHPNSTCRWNLDVTKGFVAILEFEYLRLPVNEEGACESYVQICYGNKKDKIRRTFCSTDQLDRIYTESQAVEIEAVHSGTCPKPCEDEFGFKIHYSGVAINKSIMENQILIIVLISLSVMLSLALCAFCFTYCRPKRQNNILPRQDIVCTRQPLQDIVEFKRCTTQEPPQAPRKMSFSIFQSENLNDTSSNIRRWGKDSRIDMNNTYPVTDPGRHLSIATTPRSSFFPQLSRKWSDSSVNRIKHLKTRLVSRFSTSSHHSSDISVYFSATDPMYSQLQSEEDQNDIEDIEKVKTNDLRPASTSGRIPSIVIELVD